MIYEILNTGSENAISGKEIAKLLNVGVRNVTALVEKERRDLKPICANMTGKAAGYFIAANKEELKRYTKQLYHRSNELNKTYKAMIKIKLNTENE